MQRLDEHNGLLPWCASDKGQGGLMFVPLSQVCPGSTDHNKFGSRFVQHIFLNITVILISNMQKLSSGRDRMCCWGSCMIIWCHLYGGKRYTSDFRSSSLCLCSSDRNIFSHYFYFHSMHLTPLITLSVPNISTMTYYPFQMLFLNIKCCTSYFLMSTFTRHTLNNLAKIIDFHEKCMLSYPYVLTKWNCIHVHVK